MKRPLTHTGTTMLEAMLDLFYALIFVAGAAGLAVIATLGTTRTTASDARGPSVRGSGTRVQAVVGLVAAGRRRRADVGSARWNRHEAGTMTYARHHLAHRSGQAAAESGVSAWLGARPEVPTVIMGNDDGRTWIDQQREGLVRRRHELRRDLEGIASSGRRREDIRAAGQRRDQIVAELDAIDAHLADLKVDEGNIGSMEGRE